MGLWSVSDMAGAAFKNPRMGAIAAYGLNGLMTYSTYQDSVSRGDNPLWAGIKALGSTILFNEFPFPLIAAQLAPLAPLANQAIQNWMGHTERQTMFMSPYKYKDSEYAQTSRQRALKAIEGSRMNARQFIGQEAGAFATRYR